MSEIGGGVYETIRDNTNYKAVKCEHIPELFLDRLVAKKHFGKFGKITRFILLPQRLSCTVEYETEDQAERACLEAGNFNGIDFEVNFAEHRVAQAKDTEQWIDPDVQAELDAMSSRGFGGTGRVVTKSLTPAAIRSEVPPAPAPAAKPVPMAVRSELEAMLRRPAVTDEEKYRVLDARDKLIRLKTVRQTDIKKAVTTKGTCPDMCPEKERLMREFQRQVSIFEMANNDKDSATTISHRKAIKEYSRSSADQEVPLAHELRSESVLQMTMLYLMHRIMDLCVDPQTSLGDWFHFVWDRTRSIRKDITQQELCSLGGVQLVEQCARFHIHCAARLVAEDPSVFDKKINAENLTKCLQSLKYMYHDLRIKGVQCPSEAEFRSYIILLNLGDSNFLWELKQLPESIQQSKDIQRAFAFYNALQNNNYVKFFSMIKSKETSYLSACILLGYFNKLRVRAVEVIVKSHNRGKHEVQLPLSYISEVLGFDDDAAALNFLTYYGLQCDEMEDRVFLDRMTRPSLEYAMDRALKLVESKRLVSVGECICGQPLPSAALFERHQPHTSFDLNGLLTMESWMAEDQLRGENGLPLPVKTQDTNIFKTPEVNVFKMPQATTPAIPPKQQHRQKQPENSIFGSVASQEQAKSSSSSGFKFGDIVKEELRKSPPEGFKFGGNIFGGKSNANVSSNSGPSSIFKPIQESVSESIATSKPPQDNTLTSIFKIPDSTITPTRDTASGLQQTSSIFKTNSEKSLPLSETSNIFGKFTSNETGPTTTNSTSIFGNAVKETANIFQQQPKQLSADPFRKDNVFQHFKSKPEESIFGKFVVSPPSATFNQLLTEVKAPAVVSLQSMEQRRIQLEKEHELKEKQLEEERRKLKNLEEKRMRERQLQEEQRQREVENKRIEELQRMCLQKAEAEKESITDSVINQEVAAIAHEELQRYEVLEKASEVQRDLLVSEVVSTLVEDVANEEYAIMCYDQMLLNRYFNRWLKHLRKKAEQRKLMDSTPIWVTTDTRAQFAQAVEHPCQGENLEMIKRYRLGQSCDFQQLMRLGGRSARVGNKMPLCLFSLVGQHLLRKRNFTPSGLLQQRQYFKFLISIPCDNEELPGFETFCDKWLFKHIKKAQLETGPFVHGLEHHMALCVRKLSGIYPKNEQGDEMKTEGDHSDGVVYFVSGEQYQSQARRRLYNLLYRSKNYKKLPVAIIAYNCLLDNQEVVDMLALDSLEDEGLLYSYKIIGNGLSRNDFSMYKAVRHAINFITTESYKENSSDIQSLAMEDILAFLESSLGEEMWHRWQESAKMNPVFQKVCQEPEYILGIYDKALQQLIQITQENLMEMPEFPEELKEFVPQLLKAAEIPLGLEFFPANWKDAKTKQVVNDFLQNLHLPKGGGRTPLFANVEEIELWILKYASKCLKDEKVATKAAYNAIDDLIRQLKDPSIQSLEMKVRLKLVNYLTVLKPIIYAHINATLQQFHAKLEGAAVIYIKNNLKMYKTQPWWLNYQPLDLVCVDYTQEDDTCLPVENPYSINSKEYDVTPQQFEDIIAKAQETSRRAEMSFHAIKKRNPLHKTQAYNADALRLKRTLDESLYKFELSKKIGDYDTSYIEDLTQDIDKSIEMTLNGGGQSPESCNKKRKRLSLNDQASDNTETNEKAKEMDDAIARAMQLIKKVESMEDHKKKVQASNRIYFDI